MELKDDLDEEIPPVVIEIRRILSTEEIGQVFDNAIIRRDYFKKC